MTDTINPPMQQTLISLMLELRELRKRIEQLEKKKMTERNTTEMAGF